MKSIYYHLYLLQLENYDLRWFLKTVSKSWTKPRSALRQKIVWTAKLKLVMVIAIMLHILLSAFISLVSVTLVTHYPLLITIYLTIVIFIILVFLLSYFYFAFLIAAVLIIFPFDYLLKQKIIRLAKTKITQHKDLKIIGITGSYGKTTMKEILATVLAEKYKVLKTPENINTPVGIAKLIISKLTTDTEILIVEMGAYKKGDIKELCQLTPPDISIITGINESHLERFGSIENTIAAKFEIIENAKTDAMILLNADNSLVVGSYKKYLGLKTVFFYSSSSNPFASYRIEKSKFLEDDLAFTFTIAKDAKKYNLKSPFLGEYTIGDIMGVIIVAEKLGLSEEEIVRGIAMLKPIPHRLQTIKTPEGILIIDDSYNGNPDGAREAIKALSRFKKRRKIYVTPGLVEIGDKSEEIHYRIGKELCRVADLVILIKNSATIFLGESLKKNGFPDNRIQWFNSFPETQAELKKNLKPNDVVLFQNDWPDNYF